MTVVVDHPLVGIVGGSFLLLAGIIVGYVPVRYTMDLIMIGGAYATLGLVFAVLVFLTGVGALLRVAGVGAHLTPDLSTLMGIAGIAFSLLSVFGALGGLLAGSSIGVVGGVLSILWQPSSADSDYSNKSDDHHVGTD